MHFREAVMTMYEKNPYFPNLFSPLKAGTKTIRNRMEAAPALSAFLHFISVTAPKRARSVML